MPPYATTAFGRTALRTMRGGPKTAPKKKRYQPPATIESTIARMYGSLLTDQQMRKQARQEVNLAIKQSLGTLRADQQRQLERVYRERYQAQQAEALARSAMGAGSNAGPEAWAAAGANSAATNAALAESVQGAQGAALANATGASANIAGYDQPILPGTPEANAAVAKHLGVTLPAPVFDARGRAAYARDELTREQAAAQFRNLAPGFEDELTDIRDQYTMAVQDLLGKRPSAVMEALQSRREGQRSDFATILQALGLQQTAFSNMSDAQIAAQKVAIDLGKAKTDKQRRRIEQLAKQGLSSDGKTPLPGFYRAADGTIQKVPYGSIVGPGGRLVKDPNIVRGTPAKNTTNKDRTDYLETVRQDMLSAAKGAPLYGKKPFQSFAGDQPLMSKAKAKAYLLSNFGADAIARYPGQKAFINRMIDQVLSSLGFK